MFIVRCNAGLGNRLMRMISGCCTADYFKKNVKICWPKEYDCECDYTALFDYNDNVIDTCDMYNESNLYIGQHKHLDQYEIGKAVAFDHLHSQFNIDNKQIGYTSNVIPDFITHNNIVNEVLKHRIKKSLIRKALKFINDNNIDKSVLGLVVRLTDRHNPKTITAAYNIIESNKDRQIFITCDSSDFIKTLSKFPNVIFYKQTIFPVTYDNCYELNACHNNYMPRFNKAPLRRVCYRSEESIVEAFITMLVLSQTDIHSPITQFESFFQKAAYMLYSHIDLRLFLLNN